MLHLHVHSVYTYKQSIATIEKIAKKSKEQGNNSFCITDIGSLTSFVKALSYANKNKMKFIPGCEFLVKPEQDVYNFYIENRKNFIKKEMNLKRTNEEMRENYKIELVNLEKINSVPSHSLILLAKNKEGFKNLINIFNNETQEDEDSIFLSNKESIFKNSDGLFALSGGINGDLLYYIRNKNFDKAEELLLEYKENFKDNFFVQLEYHYIKDEPGLLPEIESYNKLIELAKKHNIQFVVSNEAYYIEENKKLYSRLYKNVMTSDRLQFKSDDHWMITEERLREKLLKVYPEDAVENGFKNLKLIEEQCEEIPIPRAPSLIDNSEELIKLCEEGWKKLRKGTDREDESKERYLHELKVINDKNFSQYFIKVLNIIKLAKELGILIGPGRGSGCGSEICYLIGITCVDPLKYGLFFERFLNPERGGFPDIDIDMASVPLGGSNDAEEDESECSASRNLLVDNLIRKGFFNFSGFIQNEVAATSLVLFKNLAKYHDIPFFEANKISTSDYSEMLKQKPDKKTKKPWQYNGWLKSACDDFKLDWQDVWEPINERMQFCYDIAGTPYNSSIAASGVIMADFDTILPVHKGIIGFNGVDLESWGYIKYDLLSVNTLNGIQYFEGLDFDWNDNDDPKVWEVFQSADLDFVFQFAGSVPKEMCRKGKPTSIEHLAEINAINRPGPLNLNLNNIWVDIMNGNYEFTDENDIVLRDILKKRFGENHSGLVVYQEDVMALCQEGAGFSLSDADGIRHAMGKKIQEEMDSYKPKFIKGWIEKGTPGDPEIIWQKLVDFAKYGFNKSHAVAYSIIGYQTAKIWAYRKDEFLEYCLNYDTKTRYQQAIDKCRELGYKFVYPDIKTMGENKFRIKDGVVYVPINAGKSFDSYVDFLFDEELNVGHLIYQGVCDKLTKDRYALVDLISTIMPKTKELAKFMEPEGKKFTKLEQILDGLILSGSIVEWKNENDGIRVYVKRARSKPSEVFFHNDDSNIVKLNLIKYDLKMFGSVRDGVISDLPYISTTAIERTLNNLKERYYERGNGDKAYSAMRDKLNQYMREYFSNPYRSTFNNVYAVLEDIKEYQRSTKLILNFNDRQEILYLTQADHIRKAKIFSKKALLKMTLKYSPYIARRNESFIYDFDILEIEEITE